MTVKHQPRLAARRLHLFIVNPGSFFTMKQPHSVYVAILLMMKTAKQARSENKCADPEFVNVRSDFIYATTNSEVKITFPAHGENCSATSDLFVTISRNNKGQQIDECKFIFTGNACNVSSGSTSCLCMSESGPLAFIKRFSQEGNTTYLWTWRYQGSDIKEKLIFVVIVGKDYSNTTNYSNTTKYGNTTYEFSQANVYHIMIIGTASCCFTVVAVTFISIGVSFYRKRVRGTGNLPPPPVEWLRSEQRAPPAPVTACPQKQQSLGNLSSNLPPPPQEWCQPTDQLDQS